jgi:hypothetical protein
MKVVIFLGPTLAQAAAAGELEATYLSPAAQGDVLRAARASPFAIGIVDGFFDRVPAIWHKEILWAISQGIHVFGAASMGALRAVELAAFGMKGVGAVFEGFRDGALEDDDEVAVAHGDESTAYHPLSEAMVNIRATVAEAQRDDVVSENSASRLVALAKALYYPERAYARLVRLASAEGIPAREVEAFQAFVRTRRVDQKRLDALAMLRAIRECCEAGAPPEPARFAFAHTDAWERALQDVASRAGEG